MQTFELNQLPFRVDISASWESTGRDVFAIFENPSTGHQELLSSRSASAALTRALNPNGDINASLCRL